MEHFKGKLISTFTNSKKIYDIILFDDLSFIAFKEEAGTEPYCYSLSVNWCNFIDGKSNKKIELYVNNADYSIKYYYLHSEKLIIIGKDQNYYGKRGDTKYYWIDSKNKEIIKELISEEITVNDFFTNSIGNKILKFDNELTLIDTNSIKSEIFRKDKLLSKTLKIFNNYKWSKYFYDDASDNLIFIGLINNNIEIILYKYSTLKVIGFYSKVYFSPDNHFPLLKFDNLNKTIILEECLDDSTNILFFKIENDKITHNYGQWNLEDFINKEEVELKVIDANITSDNIFFIITYVLIHKNRNSEYISLLLNYKTDEIFYRFPNTSVH